MTLPIMGATPRYVEEMRIGGGYQSAPDGGVDMDKCGNIALDGDLSVGGALAVSGPSKCWNASVSAAEMRNISAASTTVITLMNGRVYLPVMDFSSGVDQGACFALALPAQYAGQALKFNIHWTATAGVPGDVRWIINAGIFADDESFVVDVAGVSDLDAFWGLNRLHVCVLSTTPTGASTGALLTVYLRRLGANAQDTFSGAARLIGVQVGYA